MIHWLNFSKLDHVKKLALQEQITEYNKLMEQHSFQQFQQSQQSAFAVLGNSGGRGSGSSAIVAPPNPDPVDPVYTDSQYPLNYSSSLVLWVNGRTTSSKTLSGLHNSVVNSLSSNDSNAFVFNTFTSGGNTVKQSGNDGWLYAQGLQGLFNTDKNSFRFLHSGSDWEVWCRVQINSAVATAGLNILQSNNGTSARVGINLGSITVGGGSASCNSNITNGSAALVNSTINNIMTTGSWHTMLFRKTGSLLITKVDNVVRGSGSLSGTPSPSASTDDLCIFKTSATSSITYSLNSLIRQLCIINRISTPQEETLMNTYMTEGSEGIGSGVHRYGFFMGGQSLMGGSTVDDSPPDYLTGSLGAYIYQETIGGPFTISQTIQNLDFGVNQNTENLLYHGPELSFGYGADLIKPNRVHILKHAKGGTYLRNDGSSNSWSTQNPSALFRDSLQFCWVNQFLRIHKYQLNSNLKPYFIWNLGQTDALATNPSGSNAAVQQDISTEFTAFYKEFLDRTIAAGYSTVATRALIVKVSSQFTDGVFKDGVNAAYSDFINNFRINNPSYSSKCLDAFPLLSIDDLPLTDGTHIDSDGQVIQGQRMIAVIEPYLNE